MTRVRNRNFKKSRNLVSRKTVGKTRKVGKNLNTKKKVLRNKVKYTKKIEQSGGGNKYLLNSINNALLNPNLRPYLVTYITQLTSFSNRIQTYKDTDGPLKFYRVGENYFKSGEPNKLIGCVIKLKDGNEYNVIFSTNQYTKDKGKGNSKHDTEILSKFEDNENPVYHVFFTNFSKNKKYTDSDIEVTSLTELEEVDKITKEKIIDFLNESHMIENHFYKGASGPAHMTANPLYAQATGAEEEAVYEEVGAAEADAARAEADAARAAAEARAVAAGVAPPVPESPRPQPAPVGAAAGAVAGTGAGEEAGAEAEGAEYAVPAAAPAAEATESQSQVLTTPLGEAEAQSKAVMQELRNIIKEKILFMTSEQREEYTKRIKEITRLQDINLDRIKQTLLGEIIIKLEKETITRKNQNTNNSQSEIYLKNILMEYGIKKERNEAMKFVKWLSNKIRREKSKNITAQEIYNELSKWYLKLGGTKNNPKTEELRKKAGRCFLKRNGQACTASAAG
jgi:hypothetical protein